MVSEDIKKLSLSSGDVEERKSKGQTNIKVGSKTKTVKRIVFDNLMTLFNILNFVFLFLLITVGSFKNMLFVGVVFTNIIIGIVQEVRSKRTVDRLSIVVATNIETVRNGEVVSIPAEDIVLDDIIILNSGIQIPCDCEIVEGFCYANESLLTGESDQIEKNIGDSLFSGSFVSSGEVYAKVTGVGKDNYASKIQQEASGSKKINSEIMRTLNMIIKYVSFAIIPVGIALFVNSYYINHETFRDTIVAMVAALIGMIPEGLVLLTSTVLAVAVIRLAKHKVLVQQLFCIETLARVDVLCLDKTGTITTGDLEVVGIDSMGESMETIEEALKSLAVNSVDKNGTIKAIDAYIECGALKAKSVIPFSSEKKWSGAVLSNGKSYVLGAAECIFDNSQKELFDHISQIDSKIRTVTVAVSDEPFPSKDELPNNLRPLAVVRIQDKIRDNAAQTIRYFTEQGVELKVISGDNKNTVENIASSVGIPNAEKSVDASLLKTDEELAEAIENNTVFGRVTPQQKRSFVSALRKNGHTVAMTGDGVNDVLALRESDCSIAIASGSDAAKNVSQLVLIDNDFGSMPKVVAEGRRSINNIQRSAALFIVKTIYSIVLALAFIFIPLNYPFTPLHISLMSGFTIGIPSFVLALQPNHNRIQGRFMSNVIMRAWPGSIMVIADIFILVAFSSKFTFSEFQTMCVILTSLVGVLTVIRLSLPINPLRAALIVVVVLGLFLGMVPFGWFFGIVPLSGYSVVLLSILGGATIVLYNIIYSLSVKFFGKRG